MELALQVTSELPEVNAMSKEEIPLPFSLASSTVLCIQQVVNKCLLAQYVLWRTLQTRGDPRPENTGSLGSCYNAPSQVGVARGPHFQFLVKDSSDGKKRSKKQISLSTRAREYRALVVWMGQGGENAERGTRGSVNQRLMLLPFRGLALSIS